MTGTVNNPKCIICKHEPSYAGKEPMFLIPVNYKHHILCGTCFRNLLRNETLREIDFCNLFTHYTQDLIRLKNKKEGR